MGFGFTNFEIEFEICKFKMADPKWRLGYKILPIHIKFITKGLSKSLLSKLKSKFENSKWWLAKIKF